MTENTELSPAEQRRALRPRGVQVYPMTDPDATGPASVYQPAVFFNKSGEVRVVLTEGVCYLVTDEKPWRWTDYGPCKTFSPDDLRKMVEDLEPVDLADWVRAFGDRLECNFSLAYHWATDH